MKESFLDIRALDSDLFEFLASTGCADATEHGVLPLLCRETLRICSENRPGNFLAMSTDATASLMLAWLVEAKTLQPRKLFIPESVYLKYSSVFEQLGRRICIKPLDGLLREQGNACNWLGMLELLYLDVDASTPAFSELLTLLSRQLQTGARIIVEKPLSLNNEHLQQSCSELQEDASGFMLTWKGKPVVNSSIPAEFIEQFNQDDPVAAGIPTMMSPNERFQLYYVIRKLLPMNRLPLRFIEVGSFAGGAFYETSMALKRMQVPYQGIAVEPFPNETFIKVIDFLKDNSLHLEHKSSDAAIRLAGMFQYGAVLPMFMLIDGDHSYEAVRQDILDYYPMLAPGGIIMFHDYLPQLDEQNSAFVIDRKAGEAPSIGEACRELLETDYGLTPLELPLLFPESPCQTLAYQAIIPDLFSTIRAYRKPKYHINSLAKGAKR